MKRPAKTVTALAVLFTATLFSTALTAGQETHAFKPGQVFKDCPKCPELVVVPAGIYIMGGGGKRKIEKPAHRVNVPKPFAMGRFEITFAE